MDGQIVTLPDRWIVGYAVRIQPMGADYGAIWRDGFDPHGDAVRRLAADPVYYGVYFGTDQPGWVDFVAGMVVPAGTPAPEGLVSRRLPGGTYARFDCTLSTIGATWGQIYRQWLPASGYAEAEDRPAIEAYPPAEMSPQAPVQIYVAVERVA